MPEILEELSELEGLGLLRRLEPVSGIDLSSNDYLGFSHHPEIRRGLSEFLKHDVPLGATGSRLISGHSEQAEELEHELSLVFGSEAALLFTSGYMANLGICTSLGTEGTEFFSDRFNHASLIDGMRLSRGRVSIFAHADLMRLEHLLRASRAQRKVIVTESVFSMDGDFAPLAKIIALAEQYGAYLVVDEAHGTGARGTGGLGEMKDLKFDPERTIVTHTCGKALGAHGAFICTSAPLKRLLINRARSLIYTTALPPLALEHIRLSLRQLLQEPTRVARLRENCRFMGARLRECGFGASDSHIVPLVLSGNDRVLSAASHLRERGLFVKGIRSPTVAVGTERLRITCSSEHSLEQMDSLVTHLMEWKDEHLRRGH